MKVTLKVPLIEIALLGTSAAFLLGGPAVAQSTTTVGLSAPQITAQTMAVNSKSIEANTATSENWPTVGLDYSEDRFSRLTQINTDTVKNLGLVWTVSLNAYRGVEATPIVVGGIMYVTAPWSIVHAIDIRTGKEIWTYDPKVPRTDGAKACCDVVNRGVAVYEGKVFVASFDGRLIALNSATGEKIWEIDTISDHTHVYSITDAPRVINGRVLIGNGGAEYGTRNYISAYDTHTGALDWRWYTVPGDPSKPYENASMAAAAKTWDPSSKYWITGGGGSIWNGMSYDPKLDLVYFGTGNGTPWAAGIRSPAGGSNLYLSSIVALNASTGKMAWYYQETRGDNWDYDSDQSLILTDLNIAGEQRHVLLHAAKNGFFFIIDRTNGKFIGAQNFVPENWALGYASDGTPIVNPAALDTSKSSDIIPGPYGGHNWQPMSYNPETGYAYIPAQNVPVTMKEDKTWQPNVYKPGAVMSGTGWNLAESLDTTPPTSKPFGRLIAWDVKQQKPAWTQEYVSPWNGGTLTTAGNLVFQGTADGRLVAYDARTGKNLWQSPTGTGVMAGASTYMVDGVQYVSVAVGWGGVYGLAQRATDLNSPDTVYTFALGGKAPLPNFVKYQQSALVQGVPYNTADVAPGTAIYVSNCAFCHGVPGVNNGGAVPNLGYVPASVISHLSNYVINGPFTQMGMPNFAGKLTDADVGKIAAFIQGTADAIRPKNN